MNKIILLSMTLGLVPSAFGATGTVSCGFTEPFFDLDLNLATGTLVRTEPNWESDTPATLTERHPQINPWNPLYG